MHRGGYEAAKQVWVALGQKIVVAGNADLVAVGLLAKPGHEVCHLCERASAAEITGMEKHIAGRQLEQAVLPVGIGDTDDFHKG
ncbi:MAG: hypothetical protein OHK0039_27480 [Bacteroidia bacterium]